MPVSVQAGYAATMAARALLLASMMAMAAAPAMAERSPQATLVHCGADTCLRLSGHRERVATAVRVDGRDLAVEGGRAWRITVPLSVARTWPIARGDRLDVTLTDAGREQRMTVLLPPGALGAPLELASLVISAH